MALVVTAGLVSAPAPALGRPSVEEAGCLDIVGGAADYTARTGVVRFAMELAAPSCRAADYAVRVYDLTGDLGTQRLRGNGEATLLFSVVVPVAPDGSLVAFELTTVRHDVLADAAPDRQELNAETDQNMDGLLDLAELLDGAVPATASFR